MKSLRVLLAALLVASAILTYGCDESDDLVLNPRNQTGNLQVQFLATGTHARFVDATGYQVDLLAPGTNTLVHPSSFFTRQAGNLQTFLLTDIPVGTYDVLLTALDGAGNVVGQALARNVPVQSGQTVVIDGDDYAFVAFGPYSGPYDFPPGGGPYGGGYGGYGGYGGLGGGYGGGYGGMGMPGGYGIGVPQAITPAGGAMGFAF